MLSSRARLAVACNNGRLGELNEKSEMKASASRTNCLLAIWDMQNHTRLGSIEPDESWVHVDHDGKNFGPVALECFLVVE